MNLTNLENLRIMYSNELLMDDSQKAISNGYSPLTLKLANAVITEQLFIEKTLNEGIKCWK